MNDLLKLLEQDSRLTRDELATMTGLDRKTVDQAIARFEEDGTIVGYHTTINWDKIQQESVTALIEVKVTPQRNEGFDRVAARIYRFPEVLTCYLMSGGYDLVVIVEGHSLKEVAQFVSEKLSIQDFVLSTATHFVLKRYKDRGSIYISDLKNGREAVVL